MDKPGEMLTLSQVLQKLITKNGDHELKYEQENFVDGQGEKYQPQDLLIIKTYRFEGDSNPDDSAILYIIEMPGGTTGYSMDRMERMPTRKWDMLILSAKYEWKTEKKQPFLIYDFVNQKNDLSNQ